MPSLVANSVQYLLEAEFTSGSFTNITDDLKRFNCIRDVATLNRDIKIGTASFVMDNEQRNYSPANSSGIYYGSLKPGVTIRVSATYASSKVSLFSGAIQAVAINPNIAGKTSTISAIDFIDKLKKSDARLDLYQNINAASLFSIVTSIAGIPSTAAEQISENINFVGESTAKASTLISKILKLGHYYFYANGDNETFLRNRHFNLGESPIASLNEFYNFSYAQDIETIFNHVKVKSSAKRLDTVVSTIAFTSFPQVVGDASWINFYIDFVNPYNVTQRTEATSVTPPVASLDWAVTANDDGTGSVVTASCSLYVGIFGDSAVCSLYNGSGINAYLSKFNMRGLSIYPVGNVSTIRESTSSQNEYNIISDMTVDSEYIDSLEYTQSYAEYLISRNKDPQDEISLSIKNKLPEIFRIDIGSLVNLDERESGISSNYRVMSIEHDVNLSSGVEHILSANVEEYIEPGYFKLDDPIKGTLDTLDNELLF